MTPPFPYEALAALQKQNVSYQVKNILAQK